MDLHELISVRATAEADVYSVRVDITDLNAERYETDYVSRPGDDFGLAPVIRDAVDQWIDDERPILPFEPPALDSVKAGLKAQLDMDAETVRLQFITPGAGQAMTYQQKAAEAAACLADPDPDPAHYPLLAAEIGITSETLAGVATVVHGQHQAWRIIGGLIEAARLNGKKEIDASGSVADAQAAFDAVEWPAPPD